MSDYSKMTDGDFDRILAEIMNEGKASDLLSVPGVYDAVSEHFNNEVLESWEIEQEESQEEMSFDDRLAEFVKGCNVKANENLEESYPFTVKITAKTGRRYVKLVRSEIFKATGEEQGGSAHCFIDTTNGNVLKAASWSTPAKHARGNIYNDDFGLGGVGQYGANYR